jgi:hypothetical protein
LQRWTANPAEREPRLRLEIGPRIVQPLKQRWYGFDGVRADHAEGRASTRPDFGIGITEQRREAGNGRLAGAPKDRDSDGCDQRIGLLQRYEQRFNGRPRVNRF